MDTEPPSSMGAELLLPIFVSDASAEADQLREALEREGYPAVDVPLGLLLSRVGVQAPRILLLDPLAQGAREVVHALTQADRPGFPILLLGDADWGDDDMPWVSDVLPKPIDLDAAVGRIRGLVGPPPDPSLRQRLPWGASPTEERQRRPSSPPGAPPTSVAPVSAAPPSSSEGKAELHTQFSSELLDLLSDAERRLRIEEDPSPQLSRRGSAGERLVLDSMLAGLEGDLDGAQVSRRPSEPPSQDSLGMTHQTGTAAEEQTGLEAPDNPGRGETTGRKESTGRSENVTRAPSDPPPTRPPASQVTNPDPSRTARTMPPRPKSDAPPPELVASAGTPTAIGGTGARPSNQRPSSPARADEQTGVDEARLMVTIPPLRLGTMEAVGHPSEVFSSLAEAVSSRFSGCVVQESTVGMRRIVMRDGDFCLVASAVERESIMAYLAERRAITNDVALELERRLPHFGRHAGAGLVAHGAITGDQLWSTLRAHSEWLLGHCLETDNSRLSREREIPERLAAEPATFGGATGAEVLVAIARTSLGEAHVHAWFERVGGLLLAGTKRDLLGECALSDPEHAYLVRSFGAPLERVLENAPSPDFRRLVFALAQLDVVHVPPRSLSIAPPVSGALDADAPPATTAPGRTRRPAPPLPSVSRPPPVRATTPPKPDETAATDRRNRILEQHSLVEDGDYFRVLHVAPTASGHEIRKAYVELRRRFEPSQLLCADTADLSERVDEITEVLGEAYEVLRDNSRRARYRQALAE